MRVWQVFGRSGGGIDGQISKFKLNEKQFWQFELTGSVRKCLQEAGRTEFADNLRGHRAQFLVQVQGWLLFAGFIVLRRSEFQDDTVVGCEIEIFQRLQGNGLQYTID